MIGWHYFRCYIFCNSSTTSPLYSSVSVKRLNFNIAISLKLLQFHLGVFTRLLDENDAEIQMQVLDCLLFWKDNFLLPYDQHLKNLISSKNLREELTTWSLSRESNLVEEQHRTCLVPVVIRLLVPKVRKLKTLASRKVYFI